MHHAHQPTAHYDPGLVVLSVVIAIVASFVSLDLAARVTTAAGLARKVWLVSGATMMGLGIWSMHFIGMEALRMPMDMTYDLETTLASMFVAMVGSFAALVTAGNRLRRLRGIIAGGVLMGLAIATMHYLGMAAMRMPAVIVYAPRLVALSLVIAVVAAIGALGLAFLLQREFVGQWSRRKLASASAMGVAIAGMHYTGMAAATFHPAEVPPERIAAGVRVDDLGVASIALATLGGLGLMLVGSMVDIERRRAEQALRFLADASARLSASLDADVVLADAARGVVPFLADFCAILRTDGGALRVWSAGRDPVVDQVLRGALVGPGAVLDPASPVVQRVLRDRRAEILPMGLADLGVDVTPPRGRVRRRATRVRAAMLVPVSGRGAIAGIMLLACVGDRCYGPADLALAEDLGRRIAATLENARLYREAADAVRVRDEFLSVASHELRTPMTSLKLLVQSFARKLSDGTLAAQPADRLLFAARTLGRQADRLSGLVDDLLDVSRIVAGRLELHPAPMDLTALVREVAGHFDELSRVASSPVQIVAPEPVTGCWDRSRMEQVVTNLVSNAIKYGPGRAVEIEVHRLDARAVLRVRDHGIGIDPEAQRRIFDRFERAVPSRNYGGLGLGLYIVRQIVDVHGGTIHVESTPGAGATFTVELPCVGEG
ncbi:MAG: MHYT domain-containing protein [Minicystis sp.]